MDNQEYISRLGEYQSVSAAMKTYLEFVLVTRIFPKGERLPLSESNLFSLPYLLNGSARLFSLSTEDEKEVTLYFWNKGDFIMISESTQKPIYLGIILEFTEETKIVDLEDNHLITLVKIYPEMLKIIRGLYDEQFARLLRQLEENNSLKGIDRYNSFALRYPSLLLNTPLKHIASYLGMEAKSLSQLRAKHKNSP